MPSRERKRRKKRHEEYVLNRDSELESSRFRYDADVEQRRASAREMYIANLESNRASKRWRQEKNSVAVRTSKRRRYELNSDEKRASKRQSLAREFRSRTAVVLLGNKHGNYNGWILSHNCIYLYIVLIECTGCKVHVHLYTSSHKKNVNETRYKNILSEKVSGI